MNRLAVFEYDNTKILLQFRDEHPGASPSIRLNLRSDRFSQRFCTPGALQIRPFAHHLFLKISGGFQMRNQSDARHANFVQLLVEALIGFAADLGDAGPREEGVFAVATGLSEVPNCVPTIAANE